MDISVFIKAKARDAAAFGELITPYEKLVYNICYRMTGNTEDAKDVSQDVWLKVFKNLSKCKDYEGFGAWVRTVTNNACLDFLRKKKSRLKTVSMDAAVQNNDNETTIEIEDKLAPDPLDTVIANERHELLNKSINQLKPPYKAMIVYRDINQFSYEEIARMTGLNIGTVKSQISRARKLLREILINLSQQGLI